MSKVPDDVIAQILRLLPAKSLLRFKCLSKPCCSLIDSPDFIKTHLVRSTKTSNRHSLILKDWYLYSVDLDSLHTAVELNHPLKNGGGTEAFGSCNGLIALRNSERDLALYNPSTRKLQRLPVTPIDFQGESCFRGYVFYGFGHDSVCDDYKVVRMVQFNRDDNDYFGYFFEYEVKVYSLKTGLWKRIKDLPHYLRFLFQFYYHLLHRRGYGVLASGVLHWVLPGRPELGPSNLIVAFDLRVEEFRALPQPDYDNTNFQLDVGVLADCLCIICNYDQVYVDVWMMKEYGMKESWTKLFSIQRPKSIRCLTFLRPLIYSKGGDEVLLQMNDEKLVWYNLKSRKTKAVRIDGVPSQFGTEICIESLIPLNDGGGIDRKKQQEQGEHKQNRKTRDDFLSKGFKLVL